MKRTITIFILALFAAAPGVQAQSWDLPRYVTGMHTAGSSNAINSSNARGIYRQRTRQAEERSGYHSVANGENEFYLFDDAGTFQYLGEVRQSGDGNYFPSGEGVSRNVVKNPETGVSEFVYRIGPWKRGSRHGVFLVKLPDGTYCLERWRWNRFKGVLPDEPSADEIARLEESVTRLETMLKVTDR